MLRGCVAVRVLILPAPVVNTCIGEGALRFPAQSVFSSAGVGVDHIGVTRTAFNDSIGDVAICGTFRRGDYFAHGGPHACPKIYGVACRDLGQCVYGSDMAVSEIAHMDVVTHTSAVWGSVIVAINAYLVTHTDRDLHDIGHQIVWRAHRVFTNERTWVSPTRIEVAQVYALERRRGGGIIDDLFDHDLGVPVRVDWSNYGILVEWAGLVRVVHGCGLGKHNAVHIGLFHGLEEADAAGDIGLVVAQRFGYRLGDGFKPS